MSLPLCKTNPEKHREEIKRWQRNNPDKVRLWWSSWYERNKAKSKERLRLWREKNKARKRGYDRARRVKRLGSKGAHTAEQFISLCKSFGNVCLCCKKPKPLTEDHVVPLVKGGTDYIDNIQPLCRSCNSKKNTKETDYRKKFACGDTGIVVKIKRQRIR